MYEQVVGTRIGKRLFARHMFAVCHRLHKNPVSEPSPITLFINGKNRDRPLKVNSVHFLMKFVERNTVASYACLFFFVRKPATGPRLTAKSTAPANLLICMLIITCCADPLGLYKNQIS